MPSKKKIIQDAFLVVLSLLVLMLAMTIQCLSISINGDTLISVSFKVPNFSTFTAFQWIIEIIYLLLATSVPSILILGDLLSDNEEPSTK